MLRAIFAFIGIVVMAGAALADDAGQDATSQVDLPAIVAQHILPRYERLAAKSEDLEKVGKGACTSDPAKLKQAYHAAFDAWIGVSHIRFGPSEKEDRAFALAFWPDSKGFTPKALRKLLKGDDPALRSLEEFQKVSIAGRGFFALDFLLYDEAFADNPAPHYCDLIAMVTADIAANSNAILTDWQSSYAALMSKPGNDIYRDRHEAVKRLYTALTTGLEFSAQSRIARPMGNFKKPRPRRAEAWRSERSLRNVVLSLEATRELAVLMSKGDADIDARFARAIELAEALGDPTFASVATIQGRIRVEAVQVAILQTLDQLDVDLAQRLGIGAGFNALDGD